MQPQVDALKAELAEERRRTLEVRSLSPWDHSERAPPRRRRVPHHRRALLIMSDLFSAPQLVNAMGALHPEIYQVRTSLLTNPQATGAGAADAAGAAGRWQPARRVLWPQTSLSDIYCCLMTYTNIVCSPSPKPAAPRHNQPSAPERWPAQRPYLRPSRSRSRSPSRSRSRSRSRRQQPSRIPEASITRPQRRPCRGAPARRGRRCRRRACCRARARITADDAVPGGGRPACPGALAAEAHDEAQQLAAVPARIAPPHGAPPPLPFSCAARPLDANARHARAGLSATGSSRRRQGRRRSPPR